MTAQAKRLAHESARWLSVLLLGLAAVLILGGQQRVSGPSYKFVHDLGGSDVWGLLFFAGAFAVAVASLKWPRALKWALRLAAVSFLLFALAGIGAAIASPIAGLTGIVVYLWLACWVVWVAAGVDDVR